MEEIKQISEENPEWVKALLSLNEKKMALKPSIDKTKEKTNSA